MELHVSPRTLASAVARRKRTSLQALKNEIRDRAVELLNRTSRPIKQIAPAVGFHNEKAFLGPSAVDGRDPGIGPGKGRHFVSWLIGRSTRLVTVPARIVSLVPASNYCSR